MSILHYFFGNDKKRAKFIFDFIAPVYGKADKAIEKDYREMVKVLNEKYPLKGMSVLDVGTGTGSWLTAMSQYTSGRLTGVDMSEKMLQQARAKHPDFEFVHNDAEDLAIFPDNTFDIVTASFVLHGMKSDERKKVLDEMKRVASKYVMIQDFYLEPEPFVKVLEFMERSDYRHFMKNFKTCMENNFKKSDIVISGNRSVYVGIL
jgi:ubiquinone/menaquinone biosynthesis C-methylase UbiE